jgi:hypothetical protein
VNDRYQIVLLDFNTGTSRLIYVSLLIPGHSRAWSSESWRTWGRAREITGIIKNRGLCLRETKEATLVGVPAASPGLGLCNTYYKYRARDEHHISWEMQSDGEDIIG